MCFTLLTLDVGAVFFIVVTISYIANKGSDMKHFCDGKTNCFISNQTYTCLVLFISKSYFLEYLHVKK